MPYSQPRPRVRAAVAGLLLGAGMFLGCRDDPLSGPTPRQPPTAPVATVDPSPNPEQGCWLWARADTHDRVRHATGVE